MADVKEGKDEVHSKLIKSVQYLTVTDLVSLEWEATSSRGCAGHMQIGNRIDVALHERIYCSVKGEYLIRQVNYANPHTWMTCIGGGTDEVSVTCSLTL